jgi:hypothetical protein
LATTTTSVLGHTFTVSSVPVTVRTDVRLNIKKRKEQVLYRTLSNRDNINLAYVIGEGISPQRNLFISDKSTSLVQNRVPSVQEYVKVTTGSFTTYVDKFVVTDRFTTVTATQPSEPLFYYHKLKYFNSDLADFSSRTLLSLEFADYLFQTRAVTEYETETSTGKIYNNLENTYDNVSTDFDVYYLKYAVRYIDPFTAAQTVTIYHELLNNHTVFEPATFSDVDEWGQILSGHHVYLSSELPGGSKFEVLLPTIGTYAYKELPTSRIKVKTPNALDTNSPWYLKITNGKFLTSLESGNGVYSNFKYHLPEFNSQVFSPYPPYKQHNEQRAIWLNQNLVKVPTSVIWDTSTGFFVDVLIRDATRTVKYIYSNNTAKIGEFYGETSFQYTDGILSVDEMNGFLELYNEIKDDDQVLVSYVAEEVDYELTTIDFNPLSNTDILASRVITYSLPESSKTGELDNTLFYLLVNSLGEITYSSQAVEGSLLAPSTQRLRNEDFNSAGIPTHTFYYDRASTMSGLRATQSGFFNAYLDGLSFKDKYTVESTLTTNNYATASGLYDGITGSGEIFQNIQQNPKFLVLADVFVGEAVAPESSTLIDIRRRGGGIKEEYEEETYDEQPESMWYWDHNNRLPYPGAMTFLVEVPRSILSDYGGTFTLDQIRTITERHMALGSYPCIRPYGPVDPVLTLGTGWLNGITIGWPTYSGYTYNVYRSTLRDGTYTTHATGVADSLLSSGNAYNLAGLNGGQDYYVYIAADDGTYEYKSPVYRIKTTTA